MAINDISLTAGMRNNLLSLQNTLSLVNRTQDRLGSGKQVNTALDNPTNFFAAQSHMGRVSDLATRKDGMSEAVQMVKAADAGITGISALIGAAKGIAQAALATTSATDRNAFASTFNTLMTQISQLASDSGYRGTNLLTAAKQTVEFAPVTNAATLEIKGFNATSAGLSINTASAAVGGTAITGTGSNLQWASALDVTAADTANVQSASTQLETALSTLRSKSAALSANLSVVTTRQDFTNNLMATLQTGADNLTLADMNQEGANMLMLQTRQSLGITSLSMASQAAQAILKLF